MQTWRRWGLLLGIAAVIGLSMRALPSQRPQWQIPAAGAVEFRRQWHAKAGAVCRSRAVARASALSGALPARYLHGLPPAPWLCQGELRADQRAVGGAVADLRDVLRAVAFDLTARSANARFQRVLPYGDITVRGGWSAVAEGGVQELQARLTGKAPARIGRESRELAKRLSAFCMRATQGLLVVTRTVDAARGLVTGYHGQFDLVVEEGERRFRRLQIVDEWQLVAVRANQDFDFRKRVAAAIGAGTGWVRTAIAGNKSFLVDRRGDRNYGSGRLALALLTLLHGHVPADDEVVLRGFSDLRRRRLDDAYSLATSLMAMAAWHRRSSLSDRDRGVATKWLKKMLQCVDTRTNPNELLRFNYTSGARYDTSLQQYGLLGLRAAQQIGLDLPPSVFAAAAEHLLAVQASATGAFTLTLVDHQQLRASLGSDDPPAASKQRARLRGFAYREADQPAFGSMTSAGVSGLLLARAGLLAQGGKRRTLHKRIDEAVRDGFAWLGRHFSVRVNPGFAERADNHWAYWLYCLERCCELGGVARLQGRDWYYEGGLQLLAGQNPNGSFRSGHASTLQLDSTCFAVLFLAKASAPAVITGG